MKIIQLIPQPLSGRRGPGGEIMDLDESEILKQRWLYAQSVKWLRNLMTLQKFRKLEKTIHFSLASFCRTNSVNMGEKKTGKRDKNVDRLRWINLDGCDNSSSYNSRSYTMGFTLNLDITSALTVVLYEKSWEHWEDIRCCCVVDSIVVALIPVLWLPALISSADVLISISHIVHNIRYCSQDEFFA